MEGRFI